MTRLLILVSLLAGCVQSMEPVYEVPNMRDNQLHVGISKIDIMPVPFSSDGSCPEGKFCFETFTNLGPDDGCPDNEDNYFEGLLTKPQGGDCVEPFVDANGNGKFDGLWIGGYNIARAATGIDQEVPIYAKVLTLSYNDQRVILINLPFAGFPTLQFSFLKERIAAKSNGTLSKENVIPMVIHNHGVPDTQGLWGPDLLSNYDLKLEGGESLSALLVIFKDLFDRPALPLPAFNYHNNAYWFWVEGQVMEAVKVAVNSMQPAWVKLGVRETPHRETGCQTQPFEGEIKLDCDGNGVFNEGSDLGTYSGGDIDGDCIKKDYDTPVRFLVEDLRAPFAMDYNVYTLQFLSKDSGDNIGTFLVWGHHVEEADKRNTLITGDIAEYACEMIERKIGGVCIFQVGPEGGLTSSNSGAIPYVDKDGFYYDCKGNRYEGSDQTDDFLAYLDKGELKFEQENFQDAISAGRNVAKTSLESLERTDAVYDVRGMRANHVQALLPMDNPFLYLAGKMEIFNGMSLLLRDDITPEKGKKITDVVFRGELSENNQSCGPAACIKATLNLIDLELIDKESRTKKIALATAPGELFPEYLVGRKSSSVFFQSIESDPNRKGMGDVSKHPDYPADLMTTDINPMVFVEVKGMKEVAKSMGYDEVLMLAEANGAFGYMMPRNDYLPVFEGYFEQLKFVVTAFDRILKNNGGIHEIYNLTDSDKNLSFRDILNMLDERFGPYVRNYPPPSGDDVNVMDHPNAYEETVSMGPRSGDIVYNAIYGLMTSGSYEPKVHVPKDPNTDKEILSLGKLD